MGRAPLQVCQTGDWALFQVFTHLITKEHPSHIYSDSMPSMQIIGQTIMYDGTTSHVLMAHNTVEWHYVTMSMV